MQIDLEMFARVFQGSLWALVTLLYISPSSCPPFPPIPHSPDPPLITRPWPSFISAHPLPCLLGQLMCFPSLLCSSFVASSFMTPNVSPPPASAVHICNHPPRSLNCSLYSIVTMSYFRSVLSAEGARYFFLSLISLHTSDMRSKLP